LNFSYMLVPCFKVSYLLRLAATALGYSFRDNYSQTGSDLNRIIFMSNRVVDTATSLITDIGTGTIGFDRVDNVISVSKYVTDITFIDFLTQVAMLVGGSVLINDDQRIIEIRSITRDTASQQFVDLTAKIDPETVKTEKAPYNT